MSTAKFIAVPQGTRWPSGDYANLAVIPIDPDELFSRIGLPLLHGVEEGLGSWSAIGGVLPSGAMVEFIHYAQAPGEPSVVVRADSNSLSESVLDEALQLLGLTRRELAWVHPSLET